MGTFVRARIQGQRADNVVMLPRSVLQNDNTVLVANDQRELEVRTVEVLRAEPQHVYLAGGVEDGELVVVTSLDAPIPGTKLSIVGEDNPPPTAGVPAEAPAIDGAGS
jgi:multidrug efflux pump subunit AcrA (membrane-fusion protein)